MKTLKQFTLFTFIYLGAVTVFLASKNNIDTSNKKPMNLNLISEAQ